MRSIAIICAILVAACAKAPQTPATPPEVLTYDAVADRSLAYKDADGAVTSPGRPDKGAGDRLIFTGLEAYGLDCARGDQPSAFLHSFVASPSGTSVDLDGLLGFYRGVSKRMDACADGWSDDLLRVRGYLEANDSFMPAPFDFIAAAVESHAGLRSAPTADAQAALEATVTAWVGADLAAKSACYRVNLALIALQTIESVGYPMSTAARTSFCAAALPSGIATIKEFCGEAGLSDYIANFQYNQWQYKHQRCTAWETPDGIDEAGIDFLVAYRDLHGE